MSLHEALAASSRLSIDLEALGANYRSIAERVAPAMCAAVVKADAYGVGIGRVAPALHREGCRVFFVAHYREAEQLSAAVCSGSTIFILNGLDPGAEPECARRGYVPVHNSLVQIERWRALARRLGKPLPAAIQVDSGMSRLGLAPAEALALAYEPGITGEMDLRLVLTHLACADAPDDPANLAQFARFAEVRDAFPGVPASIANTGGAFLPPHFHLDVVRPGIGLFGVSPAPRRSMLRPVVTLEARVLQIRTVPAGTGVGYGLDHVTTAPQRLATLGIGYGDGLPRSLGARGAAWYRGTRLPIVGRVSMDSITVDIDALPERALCEGDFVEIIGHSQPLDRLARDAGTIAYEVLTRLGSRPARLYHQSDLSRDIQEDLR